ncbi:MAG: NAD(P)/FAD-dependent oxidoreductase [Chloroflexi bacterium]|nr:NAD(P)/FAD-dependent oxidoreductase [Chloroflexota bacterium]
MQRFDIVVIGAGGAGEAAAHLATGRGASVAVIDRELFGGSCPFWACMPSKALLHAAAVHHAGGDYPWSKASDFRDYMINREGTDWPDDGGHVSSLEGAGATVIRGEARFAGPGRLTVTGNGGSESELEAGAVIVAVGSHSRIPDLPGLDEIEPWTNRQGTTTRELPKSLVILGAGPTGVELSQVFARYRVPVTLVHSGERINDKDHPKSSEVLARALEADGVTIRLNARAERVSARAGKDSPHVVLLDDGSSVEGHEILLAIGRDYPVGELNLGSIGVEPVSGRLDVDDRLRIAENVYVAGDVAGPEMHTHLAHYQGEMAARLALGDDVRPDQAAIPRAIYTDPETSSVGLKVEEARERGIDASEFSVDLGTTAKGYVAEAQGHATVVVDQKERILVGAFLAGPAVSETIHEAVLAIKLRTPLAVLADTIHAFPTAARVLGTAFVNAHRELEAGDTEPG